MSTSTTRRIGPQMRRAVAYVAAHPGCAKVDVARSIMPWAVGKNNGFAYGPVNRAIAAGLIIAGHGRGNAYSLRVRQDVATPTPTLPNL